MSKMTEQDIVEAIDEVLEGRPVLKWDYLVSVKQSDPAINFWIAKMQTLEELYSRRREGSMFSEEGIESLRELKTEILRSHEL